MRTFVHTLLAFCLALPTLGAVAPPETAEALAQQRQLLEKEPDNAQAYNDYGNLLLLAAADGRRRIGVPTGPATRFQAGGRALQPGLLELQRDALGEAAEGFRAVVEQDPATPGRGSSSASSRSGWGTSARRSTPTPTPFASTRC